jgi:hypothetical protein
MRIAISLDDEVLRQQFADRLGREHEVWSPRGGDELRRLALTRGLDVAVIGVLSDDLFWPHTLRALAAGVPALTLIGVVEPVRPSLDEAAVLAREIPGIGFVSRPDARFDHLVRRRLPSDQPPTYAQSLLEAVHSLPLAGVGRDFALLQALRPSLAFDIPEQAAALGASRRKLERWFQGPDVCSARRLQSVCAAAEAMYLRLVHQTPEREIAGVIGLLSSDGVPNPIGVAREIRAVFGGSRDLIREGGTAALAEAVHAELRRGHNPVRRPVRWDPGTRYWPGERVLAVRQDGLLMLVDPTRQVEQPLDGFGEEAWELMLRGATFAKLVVELAARRQETRNRTRIRLKAWLGDLLVLGLIRRDQPSASAAEGA